MRVPVKKFINVFGIVLIPLNVLLYLMTYSEWQEVLGVKETLVDRVILSFEYYVAWVLPYWWIIIIGVALVLLGLYLAVRRMFNRSN